MHAGGLRYHGMSPLLSHAVELGLVQGKAIHQAEGVLFARNEGLVPAPELDAVAAAIADARTRTSEADSVSIVIGLSGQRPIWRTRLPGVPGRRNERYRLTGAGERGIDGPSRDEERWRRRYWAPPVGRGGRTHTAAVLRARTRG